MLFVVKCPKHLKTLVFHKDTPTHKLFKCPVCDYIDYPGVVHRDLPEKYINLQAQNKQAIKFLEEALPHITCINQFQSGLITAIGTFLQALTPDQNKEQKKKT